MALEDVPTGTKIIGGLVAFSLLLALLSDGSADNDAWLDSDAAEASPSSGSDGDDGGTSACAQVEDGDGDPWTTGCGSNYGATSYDYDYDWSVPSDADSVAGAGGGLPTCDSTALFAGPAGVVVLPSDGPVPVLASRDCRLDGSASDDDAVAWLQRALAQCNGEAVAVDGVYGGETRAAVERVQAAHGLTVDATYGPATGGAMAWPLATGAATASDTACGPGPPPGPED